jgi:hypothetical protein
MQLTIIAGREQKQRHYLPVVYCGSLFRTQHAVKKKKDLAHVRSDAKLRPIFILETQTTKEKCSFKENNGQSALF